MEEQFEIMLCKTVCDWTYCFINIFMNDLFITGSFHNNIGIFFMRMLRRMIFFRLKYFDNLW